MIKKKKLSQHLTPSPEHKLKTSLIIYTIIYQFGKECLFLENTMCRQQNIQT
jgi:hypothetical protein